MATPEQQALIANTWRQVCFHLDGLAIGTSVELLHDVGCFNQLAAVDRPVAVHDLAQSNDLRPGYLNLVFRLLELQGYITRSDDVAGGDPQVAFTETGLVWREHLHAYSGYRTRVAAALMIHNGLDVTLPDAPVDVPDRIADHLRGPVAAATMTALARSEVFLEGIQGVDCGFLPHHVIPEVLAGLGWGRVEDKRLALTEAGQLALSFAAQYYYPVSYLPTLVAVPDMLRGMPADVTPREESGTENLVDRELDIAFSGIVFGRTCRDPLFDLVLPLFDQVPFDQQPRAIVDCGGGDGTVLCELYEAIAGRTARGASLATHPLTMIGVEYNPVAETILGERLNAAGVPGFVFSGDIGDPAAISARLAAEGFAPNDVLHVSKSVFHNRGFAGRKGTGLVGSSGAFVTLDGAGLNAAQIEADLEGLFAAWRDVMGRHGMVVIEAHIIDAALATERLGRSVLTSLEASHGYSHQYLLEIDAHRAAAQRAGLRTIGTRDFGAPFMGAPIMSIDHYAV